jgi:hypothetical protein
LLGRCRCAQAVVSKYVQIDESNVKFDLLSDEQITLATATFPLTGGERPMAVSVTAEAE